MEGSATQAGLTEDPAGFLTAAIRTYMAASVNNHLPDFPGEFIWEEPLVGFADGDDSLFQEYRRIIGDFHMTPREALEQQIRAAGCEARGVLSTYAAAGYPSDGCRARQRRRWAFFSSLLELLKEIAPDSGASASITGGASASIGKMAMCWMPKSWITTEETLP